MRFSVLRLLVAAIGILMLSGCGGRLELFRLESADARNPGRPASLAVRERPAQRTHSEGYILAETGATPRYSLRKPLEIAPDGAIWAFTLTGAERPLRIELFDAAGSAVAVRRLRLPESAGSVVVLVDVPGPTAVKSFAVAFDEEPGAGARAGETASHGTRLTGVAASPPSGVPVSGVTVADGRTVVGPDAVVASWDSQGEARSWSLTPVGPSWTPDTPAEIVYRYEPPAPAAPGGEPSPPTAEIAAGDATLSLKLRPGEQRAVVYPAVYGARDTQFTVTTTDPHLEMVRIGPAIGDEAADRGEPQPGGNGGASAGRGVPGPLPADLGTVRDYPWELWRDPTHEVFRWTLFPRVLIFDTRDYAVQARFFKRLAFFVEKEGFVGQILTDEQLAGRHGYNAHNYNGEGLAAFFSAAEGSSVQLTEEERELRTLLLREGIIVADGSAYAAGAGGVLSISQESWRFPGLRDLLLTHEAFHGVYYSSPEYVERIRALWRSLSDDERRYWKLFLDGMQYDVTDEYLVENEFHAYLLQQAVNGATWYFEGRGADRLRSWKPQEAVWINRFLAANAGTFRAQAAAANEILFSVTGLVAGDVYCLRPVAR